jgi:uncharacterized alpha-E superfamily protein
MLSRSAERLYWLARYLERTENSARLIRVTMNLIYDLPYSVEVSWGNLLTICAVEEEFHERFKETDEQTITRFLLVDTDNSSSLLSSLINARENIRTSRELIPDEAWEQVNEMYLNATAMLDNLTNRSDQLVFLQELMRGCQRFTGFMAGAMSHNDSYRFICLGRNIERADMTSRIMDFGTVLLAENLSQSMREYESILWLNVLKSLSASLMYRKQVRQRIKGKDVLAFLLKNPDFPGSICHCLEEIADSMARLPNSSELLMEVNSLKKQLLSVNMSEITPVLFHPVLDSMQADFNNLHTMIAKTWFLNNHNK